MAHLNHSSSIAPPAANDDEGVTTPRSTRTRNQINESPSNSDSENGRTVRTVPHVIAATGAGGTTTTTTAAATAAGANTSTTGGLRLPIDKSYCKFMELMNKKNKSGTFEEWNHLSEDTKMRVQAFKQYLRRYRVDLYTQMAARAERREEVEERIVEFKMGPAQAKEERDNLYRQESAYLRRRRSRIKIKDFQLLSLIGRGGYGEVYLCRSIETKEVLVLKRMKKTQFATNKNEVPRVHRERNMLSTMQSPWIIKLHSSFQDDAYLYLVMEYAAGGDMKTLIENMGCLDEDWCKFYFAEMLLCIEYLHSLAYIHRDLKPGNFVIDKTGHLKLIDFGLSKSGVAGRFDDNFQTWNTLRATPNNNSTLSKLMNKERSNSSAGKTGSLRRKRWGLAQSIVGSPEYIAPEMLAGEGYDQRVDIWSLGCCLYEMFTGATPFAADDAGAVFNNVMNWQDVVIKPDEMDPVTFDIIKKMLCEQEERWTVAQLKAHPFFEGLDLPTIRSTKSPFIPQLEDEIDTQYFNVGSQIEVDTEALDENFNQLLSGDPQLKIYFQGFTFKRFDG